MWEVDHLLLLLAGGMLACGKPRVLASNPSPVSLSPQVGRSSLPTCPTTPRQPSYSLLGTMQWQ